MKKHLRAAFAAAMLPFLLTALEIVPAAPRDGETVQLLNEAQKAFISLPHQERIAFFADAAKRRRLVKEGTWFPLPVKFVWRSDASEKAAFRVLVSEKPDMSSPLTAAGTAAGAKMDNLKIGQTYYWQAEAAEPGGKPVRSAIRRFRTWDRAPRLIRFPDVPNVRDLGGRPAMEGMRVKQDRVFRTAGMNNNARWIPAKTEGELFAAFPDYRELLPLWRKWRKELESKPEAFAPVRWSLGKSWNVFIFDREALTAEETESLKKLPEVPAALFGVSARKMESDKRDRLALPSTPGKRRVAVLMQSFTAPASGMMQVASGGEEAWNVRVNGQLVFSRMQGNGKGATTSNYFYFIPVRKGKNLLTVVLKSGDRRWIWCCGSRRKQKFSQNLDANIADLRKSPVRWEPGANRIKPEGRAFFLDRLKVRSDIDLRSDRECMGMTGSPLGKSVTWHHISSSSYGGMQSDWGKAQFARVFKLFLDEKNYPVIFHCIGGQDRTGAVAFILNGLLGVEEEELYLDWEATGFWNPSSQFNHERRFDHLINGFRRHPGKNMREKIEHYILECGFTREDIARFRKLMLEKPEDAGSQGR